MTSAIDELIVGFRLASRVGLDGELYAANLTLETAGVEHNAVDGAHHLLGVHGAAASTALARFREQCGEGRLFHFCLDGASGLGAWGTIALWQSGGGS